MAYMNQEKKKTINENLKPILKKYGIKSSLRVRNHSSIELTLKSSQYDFIGNYNKNTNNNIKDYLQVNNYWFQEHFTGIEKNILGELLQALRSAGYYNKNDIQSDYFDVAYYFDIEIGEWDKPYILTV